MGLTGVSSGVFPKSLTPPKGPLFFLNHKDHNYGLRLPVLGPMRRSVHERVTGSAPEAWERVQDSTTPFAIRANEPGALPPEVTRRPGQAYLVVQILWVTRRTMDNS